MKYKVFQKFEPIWSIFSAPVAPRDLKIFLVTYFLMISRMQYTTQAGLVWFGVIPEPGKISKKCSPEKTYRWIFDFLAQNDQTNVSHRRLRAFEFLGLPVGAMEDF